MWTTQPENCVEEEEGCLLKWRKIWNCAVECHDCFYYYYYYWKYNWYCGLNHVNDTARELCGKRRMPLEVPWWRANAVLKCNLMRHQNLCGFFVDLLVKSFWCICSLLSRVLHRIVGFLFHDWLSYIPRTLSLKYLILQRIEGQVMAHFPVYHLCTEKSVSVFLLVVMVFLMKWIVWGFPTRMVCLYYISCLRYTILVGNPWYRSLYSSSKWGGIASDVIVIFMPLSFYSVPWLH